MEAVQKRGRGRPRFVVATHEVRLGAKDVAALKWWQEQCGEKERGRAFRRALAVVEVAGRLSGREVLRALGRTQDTLDPHTTTFVEGRCEVNLSDEVLQCFRWWQSVSGETEKGRAWRRLLRVLMAVRSKRALAVAIQGTEGVVK